MGFDIDVRRDGRMTSINLSGCFNYEQVIAFRRTVLHSLKLEGADIAVDCAGLGYIDSFAMSELILCRNLAREQGRDIVLTHCSGLVRDALRLGNFHKIFTMN